MNMVIGLMISAGLIVGFGLLLQHVLKDYNWEEYATSDEDFARIEEHLGQGDPR